MHFATAGEEGGSTPIHYSTFLRAWRTAFPHIRCAKKKSQFSKCHDCIAFKEQLQAALKRNDEEAHEKIRSLYRAHHEHQAENRRKYVMLLRTPRAQQLIITFRWT
jgi:hypothetical protein